MAEQKNILIFSEQVQRVIVELVKKHGLALSQEDFWDFKKEDPEIAIFNAAKVIVAMEKGKSIKDVVLMLKKDLHIHEKKAEELAGDIKNEVVPLVDIIPKEEEEETIQEPTKDFHKELIQKI